MAKSIICNEKECIRCGALHDLHRHHIWGGARRDISEKHGFWMYLCADHHDMSDAGIHFNKKFDRFAKAVCQKQFEKKHTHEEFMMLIGRNYI